MATHTARARSRWTEVIIGGKFLPLPYMAFSSHSGMCLAVWKQLCPFGNISFKILLLNCLTRSSDLMHISGFFFFVWDWDHPNPPSLSSGSWITPARSILFIHTIILCVEYNVMALIPAYKQPWDPNPLNNYKLELGYILSWFQRMDVKGSDTIIQAGRYQWRLEMSESRCREGEMWGFEWQVEKTQGEWSVFWAVNKEKKYELSF